MTVATRSLPRSAHPQAPLRVVRGGAASRRSPVMVVAILVLTLFAVVGLQAFLGQEGMRVTELERDVRKAEERLTLLRARRAQLGTSARLADEAVKFGLVADPNPTYLRGSIDDDAEASELSDVQAAHRLSTGGR